MRIPSLRAGLMLGAAAALCVAPAQADDLRSRQVLVESGLFVGQAEGDAAFARLDADRSAAKGPIPAGMTFFENGAASFGQSERAGRLGSGGSTSQFRVGADREIRNGLVVGGMVGAGFGTINSADLNAQTLSRHADLYGKFARGPLFAKALIGASAFDFGALAAGVDNGKCRAMTSGVDLRVAGQLGGRFQLGGVTVSPSVALAAHANGVRGYSERGPKPFSFGDRRAQAALGSFQLRGQRSVWVDPQHKLDLEAFVGADELLAFKSTPLRATGIDGARVKITREAAPTGRGMVGGLGVGTALAAGVNLKVDYGFGVRDGLSTHSSRARLGVSF